MSVGLLRKSRRLRLPSHGMLAMNNVAPQLYSAAVKAATESDEKIFCKNINKVAKSIRKFCK